LLLVAIAGSDITFFFMFFFFFPFTKLIPSLIGNGPLPINLPKKPGYVKFGLNIGVFIFKNYVYVCERANLSKFVYSAVVEVLFSIKD
jgi:hypothetical protein